MMDLVDTANKEHFKAELVEIIALLSDEEKMALFRDVYIDQLKAQITRFPRQVQKEIVGILTYDLMATW